MPKLVSFAANRMDGGLDLNSSRNLKPEQLSLAQSVRFEPNSGVYTGPGYDEVYDSASNTHAYIWEATVFPLLWLKSGTAVKHSNDPDNGMFYDVGLTRTTGEEAFVEQGNGDVLLTNQGANSNVRIAVSDIASISVAGSTVDVRGGHGDKFAASGTVYIRGIAVTYSGKSTDQLTGCSGLTAAMVAGDIVTQTTNPGTWTEEKCRFGFELEARMILGGQVNKENILSASAPEDADNPAFFYDLDANGEVKRVLPQSLTAGIKGIGRAFLFTRRSVYQLLGFDVATGAFLMGTGPINEFYGAYNPRCAVNMDGIVSFFGRKRIMPLDLQLSPDGTQPGFGEEFDAPIRPWLESLDPDDEQDEAILSYDSTNKIKKVSGIRAGALETYVYDRQSKAFVCKENRPAASYAMFNSKPYFGGVDGKVYRDDYGRTNNGIPILHKWSTGRLEYDEGRAEMQAKDFQCDGFMSQGTEFILRIYLNGATEAAFEGTFDDSLIVSDSGSPLGTRGIGSSTLGGGDGGPLAYPFKLPMYLRGFSGEDFRFEWEVSGDGMFLQVNSYLFRTYLLSRTQRSHV